MCYKMQKKESLWADFTTSSSRLLRRIESGFLPRETGFHLMHVTSESNHFFTAESTRLYHTVNYLMCPFWWAHVQSGHHSLGNNLFRLVYLVSSSWCPSNFVYWLHALLLVAVNTFSRLLVHLSVCCSLLSSSSHVPFDSQRIHCISWSHLLSCANSWKATSDLSLCPKISWLSNSKQMQD